MCTLVNPVLQRSVISSWRLHMQRGGRKPRMISEASIPTFHDHPADLGGWRPRIIAP